MAARLGADGAKEEDSGALGSSVGGREEECEREIEGDEAVLKGTGAKVKAHQSGGMAR